MIEDLDFLDSFDSELVIGLVAPIGTEKNVVIEELKDRLTSFGYETIPIKLSSFLEDDLVLSLIHISIALLPAWA